MKKVLFVDDEPSVILGLKRMLRPLRNDWDMYFVTSGLEALKVLETDKMDVIISDVRMPGMNGVELLSTIQEKYPHMIRIILSGYTDQDLLLKSVRCAHQYLSKPCSSDKLRSTVQSTIQVQNILKSPEVKTIIAQIDSLPSLPNLYQEIIRKLGQDETSIKDIARIIEKDMGMTTQILKLVNSSFFGFFQRISDPVQATSLLGLDTIKTLVLSIEIFSSLQNGHCRESFFEKLWKHSSLTASFSRHIARTLSNERSFVDDAFMAGFLHDIGILILASKLPDKYNKVTNEINNGDKPMWEIEKQHLGASHPEIGAYLLGLWGFDDRIVEAIIQHHQLLDPSIELESLVLVLHLADAYAAQLDSFTAEGSHIKPDLHLLEKLGLTDQAKAWYTECRNLYEKGAEK